MKCQDLFSLKKKNQNVCSIMTCTLKDKVYYYHPVHFGGKSEAGTSNALLGHHWQGKIMAQGLLNFCYPCSMGTTNDWCITDVLSIIYNSTHTCKWNALHLKIHVIKVTPHVVLLVFPYVSCLFVCWRWSFTAQSTLLKVMLSQSVYLLTLFLGSLGPLSN